MISKQRWSRAIVYPPNLRTTYVRLRLRWPFVEITHPRKSSGGTP